MSAWIRRPSIALLLALAAGIVGGAQVPQQHRQPAGSALRPAVMGPSGGVSTGHPLTTAAAFSILLKGRPNWTIGTQESTPAQYLHHINAQYRSAQVGFRLTF